MSEQLNRNILFLSIAIIAIGCFSIYSATHHAGAGAQLFGGFFIRQVFWALLSIGIMLIMERVNYRRFFDLAVIFYVAAVVLLILVLFSGRVILGARRWLELGGFNFQPSELAKLGVIVVLGRYLSRRYAYGTKFLFRGFWGRMIADISVPLVIIGVPMVLIFLQPDLGTAILFIPIFLSMLFVAKVKLAHLGVFLGLSGASLPVLWHFLRGYQRDRLLVFLNPNIDPLGAGYTIIQSKIAVGSGRLFGKGWLAGTQNQLNFLPERHTDFIFSVIGEEWGFVGALVVMILVYLLIRNMVSIVEQAKDVFARFIGTGIIALFVFQIVINISMTIGICPVVGLSLPFISYGGSSLCLFATFIGILLNINKKRIVF